MSTFEAFSSDLGAKPLWGLGVKSPENFEKMIAFEAFSSNLEVEPLRAAGVRVGAPGKFRQE